jgi:hypothetical protein
MVHVPLDKSGLNYDYYIQKYEAGAGEFTHTPDGATAEVPLQSTEASWTRKIAHCIESFRQTLTFDTACATNGGVQNATTLTAVSKTGVAPRINIDQGGAWKACRNTSFTDSGGFKFHMRLASDTEWSKAADWGDLDHNGTIDQSPVVGNIGQTVNSRESGAGNTTTIRCHTDSQPGALLNTGSSETANCRSRYGAADMVGNVWEVTTNQVDSNVGRDNGEDALWLGLTLPNYNAAQYASGGHKFEFLRGTALSVGAFVSTTDDTYSVQSGVRASLRSCSWGCGLESGRFRMYLESTPAGVSGSSGYRCVY